MTTRARRVPAGRVKPTRAPGTTTVRVAGAGARQPQQMVSDVTGLTAGEHTITITHSGAGLVAVDAIRAR
jgi:hypothetical protein